MTIAKDGRQLFDALIEENRRFASGIGNKSQTDLSSPEIRLKLSTEGQKPIAAIVACADSRVAPEIIFGAGLGQLFVIRNAGNTVHSDDVLGSLEFAVLHLKTPLVIILGHSKCGAVSAAIRSINDPSVSNNVAQSPLSRHVSTITDAVKDVIESPKQIKDAAVANIKHGIRFLKSSSTPFASAVSSGDTTILGAFYDIQTGKVSLVDE